MSGLEIINDKIYINTLIDEVVSKDIVKYNSHDIVNFNNNYDNLEKINSDIVNKNNNYQNTNSKYIFHTVSL